MNYKQESGKLLSITETATGIYNAVLSSPLIAESAAVGQFVDILCDGYTLRRPISLCGFDKNLGIIRLVFEIRGKGTAWLAQMKAGDHMDIIGPLGHGFPLLDSDSKAIVVGGGIGTPPLLPLAQHYGKNTTAITGFRTSSAAILQKDLAAAGAQTILCTDDGTAGFHGFTTQALEHHLKNNACDVIYSCGPKVMMKGVAEIASKHGILCYVSMEERMGCGVGACLGCTCRTKDKNGTHMSRVCLNGPVFLASEVDWDA